MNRQPNYPEKWSSVSAVLSHDWLTGMRGGERVLELLCRGFPTSPIFTLIHNRDSVSETINSHPIHTSWLQNVPGVMKHYRFMLPLFPWAAHSLEVPDADLLISTSHCTAKSLKHGPRTRHLCYCFTPMRYAWTFYGEYFGNSPMRALLARPLLAALRKWDAKTSSGVDRFVAISEHVRKRISDFYGRDADVVYPPVDTRKWTPGAEAPGDFDLIVSALVPYKRVDLAVRAYNASGRKLKIVGIGGESRALEDMAQPNVEFLGWRADSDMLDLYRTCRMLIFPGEEDFGIVPLEAQACGKPVVAFRKGGALETIKEGVSGLFFDQQSDDSLLEAVSACDAIRWDTSAIRAHAEQFREENFINGMGNSIEKCLAERIKREA